ncbi:branched-chain amino acid ABC transporter permease [Desulfotomaculum copahuensis]|uniref:ABC transporter permease n=1 Tax=Desulfotomaculum copahuensis TaxID=1838280 RepID=A0A1B7LDQ2_9FIRM|nr:branched-chain amino acid ABC transporter permease [Desulfotomaculum copahuensis]OAT81238.1 ABC transporter permease [Desulfotomaculum copahuensis]
MNYWAVLATTVGIWVLLALSLNIITGEAGQPNIGHAAFFGIGAYTSAILNTKYGVDFWGALIVAIAVSALVGAVLGLISMRLRNDFLAITTIGLNFVTVAVFQTVHYFGGAMGIGGIQPPRIGGLAFGTLEIAGLIWVVVALVVILNRHLQKAWFGYALRAIRDDEAAAAAMGIDVRRYKVLAFVIGTGLAGLAGSIYAHFMTFISAGDFGFNISVTILAMVVLGGRGSIPGVMLGGIVLGMAPEVFRFISDYRLLVFGSILVLVMRFFPSGLLGQGSRLQELLTGFIRREGAGARVR